MVQRTSWVMLGRKPTFHSKQRGNEKMAVFKTNQREEEEGFLLVFFFFFLSMVMYRFENLSISL